MDRGLFTKTVASFREQLKDDDFWQTHIAGWEKWLAQKLSSSNGRVKAYAEEVSQNKRRKLSQDWNTIF